ncbi:lysophospholipase catalytic domain-containing protein [Melampsora americana]|nr:lysophospholipase catalytic domain-containing protein [Melampsora americana]
MRRSSWVWSWVTVALYVALQMRTTEMASAYALYPRDLAISESPTGGYAPKNVVCPADLRIRDANMYPWGLSQGEAAYISSKANLSIPLWSDFLKKAGLKDFDVVSFLDKASKTGAFAGDTVPNIALALSGGGNRALLYSSSILDAFDSRNPEAMKARTGGILQLANYATGLSAGSWLLGSWATSNFERFPSLNQTVWGYTKKNGYLSWRSLKKYPKYYSDTKKKKKAGFPVSFVDLWARMLGTQFIEDPRKGKGVLFSSVRETPAYKDHIFPLPILVSLSRPGTGKKITLQSPMYEFTPEDFGIWHPLLNASIPMEYLGSRSSPANGQVITCTKGFDNMGGILAYEIFRPRFLMARSGASSNVFSFQDGSDPDPPFWAKLLKLFIKGEFYEALVPNPFRGKGVGMLGDAGFENADLDMLLLADGAMAAENLPLFPMIQPARKVDMIFAIDSTVDGHSFPDPNVHGYPNGTALYLTYAKLQDPNYQGYPFPKVPNAMDGSFTSAGYDKRPTLFGCEDSNAPLILYIPNHFVSAQTDMPTLQTDYTWQEIDGFFQNGFYIATQSNSTYVDPEWPACLACAMIEKQRIRNSQKRTDQCSGCFSQYCAK